MCCENDQCDTSVFIKKDKKCYFLNCSKNAQFCKSLDQKMSTVNSVDDSENVIYKVSIDRSLIKSENKRETISPNIILDRSFDGQISDNSIIDEIIKSELQEINKTKDENLKIKNEIEKRQKILKISDIEKDTVDKINEFDNILSSPLIISCIVGIFGIICILVGSFIYIFRQRKTNIKNDEIKDVSDFENE